MEEHVIGEILKRDKLTLLVVKQDDCRGCHYENIPFECNVPGLVFCNGDLREDKKHVIYQDVTARIKLVNELKDKYGEVALNQAVEELKAMNLNLNL